MLFQWDYSLLQKKKEPIITISIAILFLIVVFILTGVCPDQGPKKIKQQMEKRGYSVADIDFTRTKNFSNIYVSSQPIEISERVACEYWQLVSYGTFGMLQGVVPYPDGWPKLVCVSITLETEEYQELLKSAGSESVESYIKDKLLAETTK